MSSYDKVKAGKLSFKGETGKISKKRKKKKSKTQEQQEQEQQQQQQQQVDEQTTGTVPDTGIGHAPDGKKSKQYEELFPVETKKFAYANGQTREDALDERVKKKADRYCK